VIAAIRLVVGRTTVHNFEVADFHTYYVSKQRVLVHNNGPCDVKPTKGGGKFTEPSMPESKVVEEDGVTIEHYYKSGDHGPPHVHVEGKGAKTRIGQNGKPLEGDPELSAAQARVVSGNKALIRRVVKKIGKYANYQRLK
jgi:hypothetical protein